VKEYDIYVPLFYNDGKAIEAPKFLTLHKGLVKRFKALTFFPQPNKGTWTLANVEYTDEIVIYRVLTDKSPKTRRFFVKLKAKLKKELRQEDILIVERSVKII
jgi:hypothetical protein